MLHCGFIIIFLILRWRTLASALFRAGTGYWCRRVHTSCRPPNSLWAFREKCFIEGGLCGSKNYVIWTAHKDPSFYPRCVPKVGHHFRPWGELIDSCFGGYEYISSATEHSEVIDCGFFTIHCLVRGLPRQATHWSPIVDMCGMI